MSIPILNSRVALGPGGESAFAELERSIRGALECYANVHRGTGYSSIASTALYEEARGIVLEYLGLDRGHVVIFLTAWRLRGFLASLRLGAKCRVVSSADIGLPLGIRAVAVRRRDLPGGVPFQTGGGTIRMVSPDLVHWAGAPDRFEAGTPNIIGAIAFARALQLSAGLGPGVFRDRVGCSLNADKNLDCDAPAPCEGKELLAWLKVRQVGRGLPVPTTDGQQSYVNLDHSASTPTFEPIWGAVRAAWRTPPAAWPEVVAAARATCHRFFGAPADEFDVIFASNTTEAVNIVAASMTAQARRDPDMVVLNTMLEHNSNELPWRFIPDAALLRAPVDDEGVIDTAGLERILSEYNDEHRHGERRIRLTCVCGASNVMGTYNDLAAISQVVHRHGSRLLVDAAQLTAHRPIRMQADGIDFLAFSAHKAYAPFGSGGLVCRKGMLPLDAAVRAEVVASGDENVAGIAAVSKALDLLGRIGMEAVMAEEKQNTCRALARLASVPGIRVYGVAEECSTRFPLKGGVICFELKGVPHNLAAQMIAEYGGIGVRNGCFCVNMYVKQLLGIGRVKNAAAHIGLALAPRLMNRLMMGLVRVSFGLASEKEDADRLVYTLARIAAEPPGLANRLLASLHFGTPFLPRTAAGRRVEQSVSEALAQVYGARSRKLPKPLVSSR